MKRSRQMALGVVVLLLCGAAAFGYMKTRERKAAEAASAPARAAPLLELAASDVVKVDTRELAQGLAISGTVRAANSAVVKARVAGELQALTLREGDNVQAGQVVARVDPLEFKAREKQAQEQAEAARTQIDIAKRQYDNNKALVEQGFISKTALDTSLSSLEGARSTYNAAVAAQDVARKALDDTVLRAPIAGSVSQRFAQNGERIAIDGRVLEIVDLNRLELEATLSPADSLAVRVGQNALLRIEGASAPVQATVVRVNPTAQTGSRNVLAYLSLSSVPGLRQGLFAQGTLGTSRTRALALPVSAVRTDKPQPYVQVVQGGKVVHQTVTLGARGDVEGQAMVEVSGVAPGALVLKGELGPMRDGTAVKFTSAPAP